MLTIRTILILVAMLVADSVIAQSQIPPPAPPETSHKPKANPAQHEEAPSKDHRGTETSPLFIKVVPPPAIEPEPTKEHEKARDYTSSEWWLVYLTGALSAVTFVLALYTGKLYRATVALGKEAKTTSDRQASEMQNSLTIARQSADAAIDSASTSKISMIASGRAYVHFNGCRWISHNHIDDGHIFWRISVNWINSGNTPTRGLQLYTRYELRDDPLPIEFKFVPNKTEFSPATIYPKGFAGSGGWDITGIEMDAISEHRKYLYIWGIAAYRDVFPDTKEHITKFCVFATNLSGDPLRSWHAETNPFNITFANYLWHNCADEDCD